MLSFFKRNWIGGLVGGLLMVAVFLAGQYFGRRRVQPVVWLSQDTGQYIEWDIKCKNGKNLGKIALDINLTNGKWRVVRNDPGKYPTCN